MIFGGDTEESDSGSEEEQDDGPGEEEVIRPTRRAARKSRFGVDEQFPSASKVKDEVRELIQVRSSPTFAGLQLELMNLQDSRRLNIWRIPSFSTSRKLLIHIYAAAQQSNSLLRITSTHSSKTSARLSCNSASRDCPFFLRIHKDGELWSVAQTLLDHSHPLVDRSIESESDDQLDGVEEDAPEENTPARLRQITALLLHRQIEALQNMRSHPLTGHPLLTSPFHSLGPSSSPPPPTTSPNRLPEPLGSM